MELKRLKSLRRYLSSHLPRLQAVCKEPKLTHLEFQTLYSSCNLDNSAAAETVWSIWSLQLSHRQVAVNGNRRKSAQLGFYCQNSFPAWLANNKRWQNTFDHLWWPNPYIPPSRKGPSHGHTCLLSPTWAWMLTQGETFTSRRVQQLISDGHKFWEHLRFNAQHLQLSPFHFKVTLTLWVVKCLICIQQLYLITSNCFYVNNCIVTLLLDN